MNLRFGKKTKPANPGNYVRNYARVRKEKSSRPSESTSPRVEFIPSTKPIKVELAKENQSMTAFGLVGLVVFLSLVMVILLSTMK